MLRVVFMGSDAIARPLLDSLTEPGNALAGVVAVFTQPDRPAGRGQRVQPGAIKLWAQARGLPVHQPERLTPAVLDRLVALAPDLVLVMAYGHLLSEDFLRVPPLGTLNLHASLLPRYRGASPIQTAIACGERETGVALMRMARAMDAGAVAGVERVGIGPRDTPREVEDRLAAACLPLLRRSLPSLAAGTLQFVEQDPAAATYCRRLSKEDGALDFQAPAAVLAARINGLAVWPGCTVPVAGQPLRLGLAVATLPEDSAVATAPGTVLGPTAEGLRVATGHGDLHLLRLQRPGGRMLPAAEFLRGFPVPAGTVLPSRPLPPLVARTPFRRPPP